VYNTHARSLKIDMLIYLRLGTDHDYLGVIKINPNMEMSSASSTQRTSGRKHIQTMQEGSSCLCTVLGISEYILVFPPVLMVGKYLLTRRN
jgi:hypothetical protein